MVSIILMRYPGKNDEHAIGHWRKDDPCDEVVNNFAESCSLFYYFVPMMKMDIYLQLFF